MHPMHFPAHPPWNYLPFPNHFPVRHDRLRHSPYGKNAQGFFPPAACVFVGNLSTTVCPTQMAHDLSTMLSRFGRCHVKTNKCQKKERALLDAFVQFELISAAEHMLRMGKNSISLHGRYLRVERAEAKRTAIFGYRNGAPVTHVEVWELVRNWGALEHHEFAFTKYGDGYAGTCTMMFAFIDDYKDAVKAFENDTYYYLNAVDIAAPALCYPLVPYGRRMPLPHPMEGYTPAQMVPPLSDQELMYMPPRMPAIQSEQILEHASAPNPASEDPVQESSQESAKRFARASTEEHAESPVPESPTKPARISAKRYAQRRHSCPPMPMMMPGDAELIPRSTMTSPEPEPEIDLSHLQVRTPVDLEGKRDSTPPVLAEGECQEPDVKRKEPMRNAEWNGGPETATPSPYSSRETSSGSTPVTSPYLSASDGDEGKS